MPQKLNDFDLGQTHNEKFVLDFGLYGGEGYGMTYRSNYFQTYTASGYGGSGANTSHNRGEKPTILTFRVKFSDVQEAFINGNEFSASTAIPSLSKLSAVEIKEDRYFGRQKLVVKIEVLSAT